MTNFDSDRTNALLKKYLAETILVLFFLDGTTIILPQNSETATESGTLTQKNVLQALMSYIGNGMSLVEVFRENQQYLKKEEVREFRERLVLFISIYQKYTETDVFETIKQELKQWRI